MSLLSFLEIFIPLTIAEKPTRIWQILFYGLIDGRAEGEKAVYLSSGSTEAFLWDFRENGQDPKQGLLRTKPSLAKLGDLVGFYHFMAGITTEGTKPTHGFSHRKPTLRMMEIADFFYQQGNQIYKRFSHEWFIEEGNRRRSKTHGTSIEDQAVVRGNATRGMIRDLTHMNAFVNGTETIVASAWQSFSERTDIADSERQFAVDQAAVYREDIEGDLAWGEFDEGLAEDPASRPSPSVIGIPTLFFPGRVK